MLNHGYIEPSVYVTGQGLAREQDALARAGYVVLHTDYRGHASGDPVDQDSRETRLGYTRDAVNAVDALKKLAYVDDERLAMLGRSMGGGVTQNALVAYPGLVDAAVIYASVSSRFLDNLDHFTREGRPEAVESLFAQYGTPQENPRFYRELSPRTYFDRITEPVLAHHGTVDGTCPPPWARTTQRLMQEAGRGQPADLVAGRGPRVLRPVAGLDGPDAAVPGTAPRLSSVTPITGRVPLAPWQHRGSSRRAGRTPCAPGRRSSSTGTRSRRWCARRSSRPGPARRPRSPST